MPGYGHFGQYGPWTDCSYAHAAVSKSKLQSWYPQFALHLNYVLQNSCSDEYKFYLTHSPIKDGTVCDIAAVVSCMLGNYDQLGMADMQAAVVLLGLLPTTLSLIGCSVVDIGVLAFRRPVLALLLSAGSPATSPFQSLDCKDVYDMLKLKQKPKQNQKPHEAWTPIISTIEYLLAAAAIVNLALVSYDLGVRTVLSWDANSSCIPLVWAFVSVAIHIAGMLAVAARTKLSVRDDSEEASQMFGNKQRRTVRSRLQDEFRPSAAQDPAVLCFKDESYVYSGLSWAILVGTVLHIIFGTMSFSALLFISTLDALGVAARFLASTLVCRFVLAYEMDGIRRVVEPEQDTQYSRQLEPQAAGSRR